MWALPLDAMTRFSTKAARISPCAHGPCVQLAQVCSATGIGGGYSCPRYHRVQRLSLHGPGCGVGPRIATRRLHEPPVGDKEIGGAPIAPPPPHPRPVSSVRALGTTRRPPTPTPYPVPSLLHRF